MWSDDQSHSEKISNLDKYVIYHVLFDISYITNLRFIFKNETCYEINFLFKKGRSYFVIFSIKHMFEFITHNILWLKQ